MVRQVARPTGINNLLQWEGDPQQPGLKPGAVEFRTLNGVQGTTSERISLLWHAPCDYMTQRLPVAQVVPKLVNGSLRMEHPSHLKNAVAVTKTESGRIEALITDLGRTVNMLDYHLAAEEERSQVYDPAAAGYPMLARTIRMRIENLKATIAALEAQLASTLSGALTKTIKANFSQLRRPRRNASPRRFEAWLRKVGENQN